MEFTIGGHKKKWPDRGSMPKGFRVKFTEDDLKMAEACGNERTSESRKMGLFDTLITKKQSKSESEYHGALGEIAVCKALGLEWTGKGSCITESNLPKRLIPADVEGLEVRATTYHTGRLIIRERDLEEANYVLVVLYLKDERKEAKVVGYMPGLEAKQDKFWGDIGKYNKPCYIIEQKDLKPIEELK